MKQRLLQSLLRIVLRGMAWALTISDVSARRLLRTPPEAPVGGAGIVMGGPGVSGSAQYISAGRRA